MRKKNVSDVTCIVYSLLLFNTGNVHYNIIISIENTKNTKYELLLQMMTIL